MGPLLKSCLTVPVGVGLAYSKWYHSISGGIQPHFYEKNSFPAQRLEKLQHFKENLSISIGQI